MYQPKLWKQSQTTCNFFTPEISFSKQQRFKLYSIYWPQKQSNSFNRLIKPRSQTDQIARKISKLIDQEQKNQQRMNKTQRTSAQKLQQKINIQTNKMFGKNNFNSTKPILSKDNQQVIKRLSFYSQKKQSRMRDRHGFRNPMYTDQPQPVQTERAKSANIDFLGSSKGFKTSRRINLNLPLNYYPGPGTYQIKRYLQDKSKQISQRRNPQ